ncbi:MAG: site-specific integrase, partial [Actinobacteria bacterium]|nr:site-specific integrase [Actinomycetota bacterium]
MASIARRPNGRYRARYRGPDRREHAKHFDRKVDAQRWLAMAQADLARGIYVDPNDQTAVGAYARKWLRGRAVGERTAARLDTIVRCHIEGTDLGRRRLAALRPSEVQTWASDRARVLAPSTLRKVVSTLRSIHAAAVLDRLVGSSPVVGLSLPSTGRERIVPLTIDQVRTLA